MSFYLPGFPSWFDKIVMNLKTLWVSSYAIFMLLIFYTVIYSSFEVLLTQKFIERKKIHPRTFTWLREVRVKWPTSSTNLALIPRLYERDRGSLVGEGNEDLIAYLIQSFIPLTPFKNLTFVGQLYNAWMCKHTRCFSLSEKPYWMTVLKKILIYS